MILSGFDYCKEYIVANGKAFLTKPVICLRLFQSDLIFQGLVCSTKQYIVAST